MMYEVIVMKPVLVETLSIEEKLNYQGVLMVSVDISYPAVGGVSRLCARRFNGNYQAEALKQRRTARTDLYDSAVKDWKFSQEKGYPFNPYDMTQAFEATFNSYPMLSLYYDVYQYTGGAHGMTERTGGTWDLARCRMLEMRELFRRGYDYVPVIFKYVEAEALRRQASGEAQYFEGLAGNVRRYFNEKNFFLSCQGLEVYYPLYSIAPYYVGIQVFTVPWAMFEGNLTYPIAALCS